MCRLFAQFSAEPRDAAYLLLEAPASLLEQSRAKAGCLQKDGWGVGWHERGRALVLKSRRPIYEERDALRRAARSAVSRIVIGHIRAASNPLGLPRARLLTEANAQPFSDGRWLFAHNGTLNIPKETAGALGRLRSRLRGENDSEVYFWHLLKHLRREGDFERALRSALAELWELWEGCRSEHPGLTAPYSAVNTLLSDGETLYAVCHQAVPGSILSGACNPDQPWGQMSVSRRPGLVVVASEDMDRGRWTRMRPPELLTMRLRSGRIEVARRALSGLPQAPLPRMEAAA
ncbi:MAG: class II glutamine amidotransferase [Elusimicrobia bacterium]|nr:class II glutamine amidotransferase [Elusimicrobiota bacterium]MDE2425870.1 class II glutamine amidotransferase [Elusimicrobiota bacterium]